MSFAELRKNNIETTKQDELEISKLQQIEKDIMDVNTIYNDLNKMVATDNEKIEKITEKVEENNDKSCNPLYDLLMSEYPSFDYRRLCLSFLMFSNQ